MDKWIQAFDIFILYHLIDVHYLLQSIELHFYTELFQINFLLLQRQFYNKRYGQNSGLASWPSKKYGCSISIKLYIIQDVWHLTESYLRAKMTILFVMIKSCVLEILLQMQHDLCASKQTGASFYPSFIYYTKKWGA